MNKHDKIRAFRIKIDTLWNDDLYSHSVFMAVSPMFFGVFSSHKPHILERLFCVSLFCVLFMYLEIRYLTIIFILTKGGFDQIIKSISQSGNELKI